jgi:hypothetical protein
MIMEWLCGSDSCVQGKDIKQKKKQVPVVHHQKVAEVESQDVDVKLIFMLSTLQKASISLQHYLRDITMPL